jgi:hypothetical protein
VSPSKASRCCYSAPLHLPRFGPHPNERSDPPACTPAAPARSPRQSQSGISCTAAVPDRRRMRQYGCEQGRTKTSSRRDADAARDAGGRCAPRRPRPRARNVRGGRAMRTHVSRSSRGNRSDVPRSPVTSARMPSCARCRSCTARVSRLIVSSSPCAWDAGRWRGGRAAQVKSSSRTSPSNRDSFDRCVSRPRPPSPAIPTTVVRVSVAV